MITSISADLLKKGMGVCVCLCVCVDMCIYVCYMCSFKHSYVFGFGCNKNVLCRIVSSVGMCWFILSYVVCINVSFNIGCVCFVIGDSGGNAVDMCGVVSLIL